MQEILWKTKVKKGKIAAFLELHIEQGPLLEAEGLRLGIVTAIAAPAALRIRFQGGGGHAGALLMPDRYTQPCGFPRLCFFTMMEEDSLDSGTPVIVVAAQRDMLLIWIDLPTAGLTGAYIEEYRS